MLGKLFKYELRSGAMYFPLIYVIIGALWLLGLLASRLHVAQMTVLVFILLFIMMIAPIIGAVVYVCVRFHKSLFGAEGYLMQTLPVDKGQLILVKAILAFALLLLGYGATFFSAAALLNLANAGDFWDILTAMFGKMFAGLFIYVVAVSLVQLFSYVGIIFFSITLANTKPFLSHNVLFAVLFYFGVSFVVGIIESLALLLIPLSLVFSDSGVAFSFSTMVGSLADMFTGSSMFISSVTFGLGTVIVDIAAGIGLLFVTRWLMTRKTSVK